MLRIPAPTAQDRANQWSDAYNAAEARFTKIFKNSPHFICYLNEVFLERVCDGIAEQYGIPIYMPSQHISGDNALMIALAAGMNEKPRENRPLKADGTKRLGK